MLRLFALALLLFPLALTAQPLTAWETLDDRRIDWSETNCLAHHGWLVCRYPNDIGPGFTFELSLNARPLANWEAHGWAYTGFEVFEGDLDGNGTTELLVANNDAVSNGMAVSYWTLYLLTQENEAWHLASSISVEEFGGMRSFAEDGGLVLWATEWLDSPDPSGERGDGLYFVGRPFRFAEGSLVPATDLPLRARRFLDSFGEQRGSGPPNPVAWLADTRAETRTEDPYLVPESAYGGHIGVIERVEVRENPYGGPPDRVLYVDGREGGDLRRFVYTDNLYASSATEDETPFRYFGDRATQRLYPSGYLAADPGAWLTGRAIVITTHGEDDERFVLWLE